LLRPLAQDDVAGHGERLDGAGDLDLGEVVVLGAVRLLHREGGVRAEQADGDAVALAGAHGADEDAGALAEADLVGVDGAVHALLLQEIQETSRLMRTAIRRPAGPTASRRSWLSTRKLLRGWTRFGFLTQSAASISRWSRTVAASKTFLV